MSAAEDAQLDAVADAAAGAIGAQGWVPVNVLVLANVVTENGEREVLIAPSGDIRATDTLGLLHYAVARETAGIAREVNGG